MLKKLFVVLLVFAVVAFGARNQLQQFTQTRLLLTGPYFDLPAGSSLSSLCQQWQQQRLLSAAQCWQLKIFSVLRPELRQIKAGVYRVRPDLLFSQLALFRSGKVAQFSFMLREGETLQQSLAALATAEYLQQDVTDVATLAALLQWPADWGNSPVNSEALFLPETYFYTAHSKASELYLRAHRALIQQLAQAWQQRDPALPFSSPYQLLTLASLI